MQDPQNVLLAESETAKAREFYELRSMEESFFKQKSRIRWLKEGDQNTRFFHQSVNHHHLRNRIISVQDGVGNMITEPEEIQGAFVSYFHNLLTREDSVMRPSTSEIKEVL
ncbi:hypothetical protein BT93_K2265 [Corymbia citriodora subsp. variegata]|nr:hypothetical protein BT93_K2265 [Corymbia citriodora subsp. variegata]